MLALVEGRLVLVEVKSSPPKHVTVDVLVQFFRRIEALGPAMAVFLEDTHLRLEDKIVPMFQEAIRARGTAHGTATIVQERKHLYSVQPDPGAANEGRWGPGLLIAGAQPSLEANVAHCLRRLLVTGDNRLESSADGSG